MFDYDLNPTFGILFNLLEYLTLSVYPYRKCFTTEKS